LLVYVEYISRLPGVSLKAFHFAAGRQVAWSGEYEDDQLVLNIGRTFRTGPEPGYIAVWYTPGAGLSRIGDWKSLFETGAADHLEEPFKLAARIDRAGCYEALLDPVPGKGGVYYGEFLDFATGATRDEVQAFFEQRCERNDRLVLNLLVDRIGKLGPEPRCLAFWSAGDYGDLEEIARELDDIAEPVNLVAAGFYADLGDEIL
jgi:hypothetical protein